MNGHVRSSGDLLCRKLATISAIRRGAITRSALSERLGLSLAFVGAVVKDLQESDLVVEGDTVPAANGRRPRTLRLSPDLGLVLGLDIGTGTPRAVLADFNGEVVSRVELPAPDPPQVEDLVDTAAGLVPQILRQAGVPSQSVRVCGLAVQAMVDYEADLCFKAGHLHAEGVLVGGPLEERLGCAVAVEDVSRCLALGESFYGAGRDGRNVLVVFVGSGVGAALVVDGDVFRGSSGIALELGHVIVSEDGPRCRCGNRGCVQTYASTAAIVDRARLALSEGVDSLLGQMAKQKALAIEDVLGAADAGDKLGYRLLSRAGEALGTALASALNLTGSEMVIIHSAVPGLAAALLDPIRHQVRMRALPELSHRVRVEEGRLGPYGPAMGAAALVTDLALTRPEVIFAGLPTRA